MKGDFTRNTFDRARHYSGVRMQQGRVQLDADWNEQRDIEAYRSHVTHRDVIGYCGGPQGRDADGNDLAGFGISASGDDLLVGAGRYYVNGLLVENEAEVSIGGQPDLPGYDPIPDLEAGVYLAYLDVWERHITALEDDAIREVALGGPDTATRTRALAQVRLERVGEPGEVVDCSAFGPDWVPPGAAGSGRLAARSEPGGDADNPCIVPPNAGYRRLENQLYRVEIHTGGASGVATFKWSRENGSIVSRWESQDGDNLGVSSVGKDQLLRFSDGDWVELSDDTRDLRGRPGVLVRLQQVEGNVLTIDASTIQDPDDPTAGSVDLADFPLNPKIRRWESEGAESVEIPVENDGWLELEDGVWVHFQAGGVYHTGDYWTIPARTALGDVQWPDDEVTGEPAFQLRHGIAHSYCPLAIGEFSANGWGDLNDCRKTFPPLTELPSGDQDCCTHTVGDGVHSVGDFQSIQAAVDALDPELGGTLCILPGVYPLSEPVNVELPYIAMRGCGRQARITAASGVAAFVIRGAKTGVHLRDLSVRASALRGAVRIEECFDVLVEDCEIIDRGQLRPTPEMPPIERPRPSRPTGDITNLPRRPGGGVSIIGRRRLNPAVEPRLSHLADTERPLAVATVRREFLRALLAPPVGPALYLRACRRVDIHDNLLFGLPAISVQARDVDIRANHLSGGGAWLWDGCSHVDIDANAIAHGEGPGIVLGGLPDGEEVAKDASGVLQVDIHANHILGMANSGISSVVDVEENLELGELEDIVIAHNRIESCGLDGVDPAWEPLAVGGVVLRGVTGLRIHDNLIERNQPSDGGPAVGVFLHLCLGLEVADNRIIDNGGAGNAEQGLCVDYREEEANTTGPNPRTEQGMVFTVLDGQGNPESETRISRFGAFTGLNAGRVTTVQLPEAVPTASVTLVSFNRPGAVEALDAAGNRVDRAVMSVDQGVAQTLTLVGEGITQLHVQAPGFEVLILEVCAGIRQANGFQAGIAAWYVLGGSLRLPGDSAPIDDFQRDTPAATIRDNIVSAPRGQALILTGMGSMSVDGNSLTSHGVYAQPVVNGEDGPDALDNASQVGKCVTLVNLGLAAAFSDALLGLSTTKVTHVSNAATPASSLPDGLTRFDGNQVKLEIGGKQGQVLSSTALLSFDDISAQDNQLLSRAPRSFLISDLVAASPTLRVAGNSLVELPNRAFFSCMSVGTRQNATLANQATHCIWALGGDVLRRHNQILINSDLCEQLNEQTG